MNLLKRFALLFITLLFLLPAALKAEIWTAETLPMVHLQDRSQFVCNPDGVLTPATVDSANVILGNLKKVKGVEAIVVVVKRVKGKDLYQFGMDLSRKYGIGDKKENTGLLILLSTEDRKYQILTGIGMEGTLPDGLCYKIQQKAMVPALKAQQWDNAIYETVKAVNGVIMKDETIVKAYEEEEGGDGALIGVVLVITIVVFFLVFQSSNKKAHRCPQCKKQGSYNLVNKRRIRKNGRWYTEYTWKCNACGYTFSREYDDSDSDDFSSGSGMFVPPIFMSSGRHHSGGGWGGGFGGGGSFGGGSFGGGGAGGDF